MAKLTLPAQDWTAELVSTSADKAAKASGATSVKMLMVPVAAIRPIPGFNVRVETPDYLEHIDSLTQSILANGFYPNKPLGGYAGKDDGADVIFVTDGYSRLRAVEAAISFGAEIAALPVVIKPQTDTLEDLTVALVQDNEGRPLTFYEKAIVAKRLLSYNMEKATVAKRLNVTERGLDDFILVAGAPSKVRDLLISGKVSASLAVVQLRKNPEKAADVLRSAVTTAEAAGKTKASAKHITSGETTTKGAASATSKPHQRKSVYRLIGGETVSRDQIKELLAVESGDAKWWSYVDESDKKKGILIDRTLTITLIVEDASLDGTPAEDESLEAAPAAKAKPAAAKTPAKPAAKGKAPAKPAAAKTTPAAPSKPGDKKKIGAKAEPAAEAASDELDNISLDDETPTIQTDDVFDEAAGDGEL